MARRASAEITVSMSEGNTNNGGSWEGIGVFRRNGPSIVSINLGFIAFS